MDPRRKQRNVDNDDNIEEVAIRNRNAAVESNVNLVSEEQTSVVLYLIIYDDDIIRRILQKKVVRNGKTL